MSIDLTEKRAIAEVPQTVFQPASRAAANAHAAEWAPEYLHDLDWDPADDEAADSPVKASTASRAGRWVAGTAVAVALIGIEAVIAAESFGGLVEFAHLIGITSRAAYGVPVTLDGVGLVASLLALRAELSGESSSSPRFAMYLFTGASIAANWWAHSHHAAAAIYYGGMSLAVAYMFALLLRQLRAADRRRAGLVADRLPKLAFLLWLRYPLLAYNAWSLAVLHALRTPREAVNAAIAARAQAKADKLPAICLDSEALASMTPRDRLVVAFGAIGAIDVPKALALLDKHDVGIDQSHAYQIRKALTGGEK